MSEIFPTAGRSTTARTPAGSAACWPRPCTTPRQRTRQTTGTRRTTGCSGSAWRTASRIGVKARSSTSSSSNACRPSTGRSSHGSSSSRTVFLGTHPALNMKRRAHSKNRWDEKRCRSSGRSTRSTSPSTVMFITMKGHVQSIRYVSS